jgi:hypothetical protein
VPKKKKKKKKKREEKKLEIQAGTTEMLHLYNTRDTTKVKNRVTQTPIQMSFDCKI